MGYWTFPIFRSNLNAMLSLLSMRYTHSSHNASALGHHCLQLGPLSVWGPPATRDIPYTYATAYTLKVSNTAAARWGDQPPTANSQRDAGHGAPGVASIRQIA